MRRVIEFWVCLGLFVALLSNATHAQQIDFKDAQEGIKWLTSQGGLTIAWLVTAWAYRRDMLAQGKRDREDADLKRAEAASKVAEKEHHIDMLVELVKANTTAVATQNMSMSELVLTVKTLAKDVAERRSGEERRR